MKKPEKPPWLDRKLSFSRTESFRGKISGVKTVCREARCPNISECWSRGRATFLILGKVCTRGCRFCNMRKGRPGPPDPSEPGRIARTVRTLGVKHAVLTSPTRDDLEDGGASYFAEASGILREFCSVEVLIPDFAGNREAVMSVAESGPHIVGHNIETVERLYRLRTGASYRRSLEVIRTASGPGGAVTKSALMLGLGETRDEVIRVMDDLLDAGCLRLSLGQYLRPGLRNYPVSEYIRPEVFEEYGSIGRGMGFEEVTSGLYVRSSYYEGEGENI